MYSKDRKLSYSLAINEAFHQVMARDKTVILMGQGVKSPWYVGNTVNGLLARFGSNRIIDTPVSENAVTGAGVGAALAGLKPIIVHPRMDFMFYAFDPIINEAANWHYMFGGRSAVPLVIWGIINRGGEQAAQHSQSLHAMFAHIPGLKVVMPSTPYDAKGLMVSAIQDKNPVIYIDDRWLYGLEGVVPEKLYEIPIGKGIIRRKGKDITLVGFSYMMVEAIRAAEILEKEGIDVEVIDLRSLKPLDKKLVFNSVRKTGRLIVLDGGWKTCGFSAEISALVTETIFDFLKTPIFRVTLPDCPAPASEVLEKKYYPDSKDIVRSIKKLLKGGGRIAR